MRLRTSFATLFLAALVLIGLAPAPAANAAIVIRSTSNPLSNVQTGSVIQSGSVIRISGPTAPAVQPAPAAPAAPAPQPAPAPAVQPAPAVPAPSSAAGPQIVGSDAFRAKVGQALQLLQTKAPAYWDIVRNNLLWIEEGPASGTFVWTRTFTIGAATANSDPYWLASVIVHDAYHVHQYLQGKPYAGQAAEAECLGIQRQALIAMGASQYMIGHVDNQLKTQYWTVPYSRRGW